MRQKDWLFHHLAPIYDFLIRKPQDDRLRDLLDLPPKGVMFDIGVGDRVGNRPAFQILGHTF